MPDAYLDSDWVNRGSDFKASLLKHHDGCVVDAGACKKETDQDVRIKSSKSNVTLYYFIILLLLILFYLLLLIMQNIIISLIKILKYRSSIHL